MKRIKIELVPLAESHLELVRNWRNDTRIAQFMQFQEEITETMQLDWFNSIENAYYFIIQVDKNPIGLIDVKKIDLQLMTGECGLFIGEKMFLGTGITLDASIQLLDFCFNKLQLNAVTAKMHRDNKDAVDYNKLLGFKLQDEDESNPVFIVGTLSKERYLSKRSLLVTILK